MVDLLIVNFLNRYAPLFTFWRECFINQSEGMCYIAWIHMIILEVNASILLSDQVFVLFSYSSNHTVLLDLAFLLVFNWYIRLLTLGFRSKWNLIRKYPYEASDSKSNDEEF